MARSRAISTARFRGRSPRAFAAGSITADQWSWIAFGTTLLGAAAFVLRLPRFAALLVHAGSVLDGVDGEVARRGRARPGPAVRSSISRSIARPTSRWSLRWRAVLGAEPANWIAALVAANGIVTASVVKERLSAEAVAASDTQRSEAASGWRRLLMPFGSRDGRLFAIALLGIARKPRLALWWLAAHSSLRLVERVRVGRELLSMDDERGRSEA